MNVINISIVTA